MAIIISTNGSKAVKVEKSSIDKEEYLQKYIYENPESIPLYEIKEDIRLLILAREFPTNSGPIDAIGIDKYGELYIVETKLYTNADKRKVIAQSLDYGAALWKHSSDFNEFIGILDEHTKRVFKMRTVEKIGEFFEIDSDEVDTIIDKARVNLNNGVFHFVVLMDKLDDRLKDLILYVNQNSQFDIYAVELEYYKHENQEIIIPRIFGAEVKKSVEGGGTGKGRKEFEPWWKPVLNMKFDNPEQPAPYWAAPNNIVLETPCPGIVIKAHKDGIFLSKSKKGTWEEVDRFIASEGKQVKTELPTGVLAGTKDDDYLYLRNKGNTGSDEQKYDWLIKNLNTYVSVLRPRLKKWQEKISAK